MTVTSFPRRSSGDGPLYGIIRACNAVVNRCRVVTGIRRALITVFNGDDGGDLRRLARLLSGSDLIAEKTGNVEALLAQIHHRDRTVECYTEPAKTWATVTPVVLPGYDDPREVRKRLFARPESDSHPSNWESGRNGSKSSTRESTRVDSRKVVIARGPR
jgi:CRISPR-associated protein Csb2